MQPRSRKRLKLATETIRVITFTRNQVVGGISGLRGCHSIDIRCNDPTSAGALCSPSDDQQCGSGNAGGCGASAHSVCP
jgi:hypothetical protein